MLFVTVARHLKQLNTLLHCPLHIHTRDITIHTVPLHYITIPILLNSDPNLPSAVNSSIFLTVKKKFIIYSGRDRNIVVFSLSLSPYTRTLAHTCTRMHACTRMSICLFVCLFVCFPNANSNYLLYLTIMLVDF